MGLKPVVPALIGVVLLAAGSFAMADEYRPDQFLGLDLSKAVLSPKPLGPATEFAPVAVEAKTDGATDGATDRAAEAAPPAVEPGIAILKTRLAHVRSEKPRGAAQTRLARRHG